MERDFRDPAYFEDIKICTICYIPKNTGRPKTARVCISGSCVSSNGDARLRVRYSLSDAQFFISCSTIYSVEDVVVKA